MFSFETRSLDRDRMFIMADVLFEGAQEMTRVTVRNLSAGGLMAEHEMRVKRGQRVALELRNIGLVEGVVVWVRSPLFGIAFKKEIDPTLARTQVHGGARTAPTFVQAAHPPPRREAWTGRLRRV